MVKYAETKRSIFAKATPNGWDTIQVESDSRPGKFYTVDVTNGRCSCPAWVFQKGGERKPCKHLKKFYFKQIIAGATVAEPKKVATGVGVKIKMKEGGK